MNKQHLQHIARLILPVLAFVATLGLLVWQAMPLVQGTQKPEQLAVWP